MVLDARLIASGDLVLRTLSTESAMSGRASAEEFE
jgi:hypothetical protein